MRAHDPLSYIDPRARNYNGLNMPIPPPMLMPAAPHPPPNFFAANVQMMHSAQQQSQRTAVGRGGKKLTGPSNGNNKKSRAPRFSQNTMSQTSSLGLSQGDPQSQMHSQQYFRNNNISGANQAQHSQVKTDNCVNNFRV